MATYDITPGGAAVGWLGYDGTLDGAEASAESVSCVVGGGRTFMLCKLDATTIAKVYMSTSGTGHVRLAIGTINPTTKAITWGTPVSVTTAASDKRGIGITALSATKLCAYFRDSGSGATGQVAKTYTVSGTTPTLDATLTIDATQSTSGTQHLDIHALSSTRLAAFYWNGTNRRMVGLTAGSGTLAADATSVILTDASNANVTAATGGQYYAANFVPISSSQFLVFYITANNQGGLARIVNDSGSLLSFGNTVGTHPSCGNVPKAAQLSSDTTLFSVLADGSGRTIDNQSSLMVDIVNSTGLPRICGIGQTPLTVGTLNTFPVIGTLGLNPVSSDVTRLGGYGAKSDEAAFSRFSEKFVDTTKVSTDVQNTGVVSLSNKLAVAYYPNGSSYPTAKVMAIA